MQIKGRRRWLGVRIAFGGALLSILFGALAILFGENPQGIPFTVFFWLGALSAPLVFVGIAVQVVMTFSQKGESHLKK